MPTEIQRLQTELDVALATLVWRTGPIDTDALIVAVWDDARGRHIEGGPAGDFGAVTCWMPLPPVP